MIIPQQAVLFQTKGQVANFVDTFKRERKRSQGLLGFVPYNTLTRERERERERDLCG
uniref:Uncharacterized protein n=1 Tax=Nelumbo nucifera TaxID=4432 RepID=A0A822XRG9_NELNU|nr:TPA_asm: hypothetical protein HUJ06_024075 [Nelumbo nucifera]